MQLCDFVFIPRACKHLNIRHELRESLEPVQSVWWEFECEDCGKILEDLPHVGCSFVSSDRSCVHVYDEESCVLCGLIPTEHTGPNDISDRISRAGRKAHALETQGASKGGVFENKSKLPGPGHVYWTALNINRKGGTMM